MNIENLVNQILDWAEKNSKRLKTWSLIVFLIAFILSLIKLDWSRTGGFVISIGVSTFTIFIVLLLCSPVLVAILLLAGGKIKAGGFEVSIESIFRLISDKNTKDELLGILGAEAERAMQAGSKEDEAVGRKVRDALDDIAQENDSKESANLMLDRLAKDYEHIRSTMQSGNTRTRAMTAIQTKMRGAVKHHGPSIEQVSTWLQSEREGDRILGVTFAREQSDPAYFGGVLKQIDEPHSAFEQYQALLAAERMVPRLNTEEHSRLRQALDRQRRSGGYLHKKNDRRAISDRILKRLQD